MADIVKKIANGEIDETIDVDKIRKSGDYIREKILDTAEVDLSKTAPNVFNYSLQKNNLGLNEISNVDMGYAGTSIDFAGEHLS